MPTTLHKYVRARVFVRFGKRMRLDYLPIYIGIIDSKKWSKKMKIPEKRKQ